ncbi:MAG TPA: DNA gyrase inhibitor YacG [Reyranellaceae bacterium]|nr:DNA gyrase inhibitor YacG [Reyranellaceae bacterium]
MGDKPPLRAVRIAPKCAVCSKPAEEKYKPFCSKRCADIDLGRWLKESYRVPTDEGPGEEEPKTRSEEGG